jgi:citrate lyase beta subunit
MTSNHAPTGANGARPGLPAVRRTLLFLPAVRPERFPKAVASGADAVCLDLEDAVPPPDKARALELVLELLDGLEPPPVEVMVRVNPVTSELGLAELAALAERDLTLDTVLLTKAASAADVRRAEASFAKKGRPTRLIPIIENAQALFHIEEVALASKRIAALMLGGVDMSVSLGAAMEWDSLLYARSRVVAAAALAGVESVDSPNLDVAELEGLRKEARAVARLGFTCKAAIHPAQVPVIHEAFRPSTEEVERARRIMAAFDEHEGAAVLVDGRLVDVAVFLAAKRVVALAERAERRG